MVQKVLSSSLGGQMNDTGRMIMYVSIKPARIYVNSALIYQLHSSHLQFSTPLPPPTVHLLRKLGASDTINNIEILNIYI